MSSPDGMMGDRAPDTRSLWRVFPWDPDARAGDLFSPSFVPRSTGRGRFDLPLDRSSILYLAESPEHAVAEALHPWRNRPLRPVHLERAGHRLALVEVAVHVALGDLCDPSVLIDLDTGPHLVASRKRRVTQGVVDRVWRAGHGGLRWWSAFGGDWHGVVVFLARCERAPHFGPPTELSLDNTAVAAAADALGMSIAG